jgi:hypothetical protein
MFESLKARWQEARGAQLKKELLDAFRHMNNFTEQQSERCGKALVFLAQSLVQKQGPIKGCEKELRKVMAEVFKKEAQKRSETDRGASFGFALFSMHLESSFLTGDDASFAYEMTSKAIKDSMALLNNLEGNQPI